MESDCCDVTESDCRDVVGFVAAMNAFTAQTTDPRACGAFVQRALTRLLTTSCHLASAYMIPTSASYARHLIYRHPDDRYSIVAMVWLPGQGTPIHDHGGVWCVEGVYRGQMQVTQYDVTPLDAQRVKAVPVQRIQSGLGNVGALIPPHDYHTMHNASPETAVTIHVYGADLKHCHVFMEEGESLYTIHERALRYTSEPVWGA